MKRLLLGLAAGLMLLPAAAAAQTPLPPADLTEGFINGRLWNDAPQDHKTIIAMAMMQSMGGVKWIVSAQHGEDSVEYKAMENLYPGGSYTAGDLSDEIDALYRDPRNRNIPVLFVFTTASQVLAGYKPAEIEHTLDLLRAIFK